MSGGNVLTQKTKMEVHDYNVCPIYVSMLRLIYTKQKMANKIGRLPSVVAYRSVIFL